MRKIRIIIIGLIFCGNMNAQTDTLKHAVKFNIDANILHKWEGIVIDYLVFEKTISKKTSLLLGIGYDFHSSNLIVDSQESVVSRQAVKIKFDYRYYCSNTMNGLYIFPSIAYNLDITNESNQKNNQIGFYLGFGYQKIWKKLVFDVQIDKGYTYSYLRNDEIKFMTSKTLQFSIIFSTGFIF
jgi:hypothetical protein